MPIDKAIIRTVRADIEPAQLGRCYAHEHLWGQPPPQLASPDLMLDKRQMALQELRQFKQAGGQAIVEMTTPDYGRDAQALYWLSEQSDVHIIAATGYNHEKFSAPFLESTSLRDLVAAYQQDVTHGMDASTIKAGVIKAASPLNAISPLAEKMLQAAAQAHLATGAPISTHTEAGTMALEQIERLTTAGVEPQHIIIGHLDRKLEWAYHLEIAQRGVYLGYDQISKAKYYADAQRAGFIKRLMDAGHGPQILLSGDLARRSYWYSYTGGAAPGFSYILKQFLPLLAEHGLREDQIQMLLLNNPARAFSFVPEGSSA